MLLLIIKIIFLLSLYTIIPIVVFFSLVFLWNFLKDMKEKKAWEKYVQSDEYKLEEEKKAKEEEEWRALRYKEWCIKNNLEINDKKYNEKKEILKK